MKTDYDKLKDLLDHWGIEYRVAGSEDRPSITLCAPSDPPTLEGMEVDFNFLGNEFNHWGIYEEDE